MWKQLLVISVATAALSVAATVNVDARGMGMRGDSDRVTTEHMGFNARAEARGPGFRPHGWSEGRKTGWHCRVGARGCIPPGLR